MNSFMTSLSKNVKPNFVTNPMELLATKATVILDCRPYVAQYDYIAHDLFIPTEQGVYLPWATDPLFTAYEELYTHRDSYDFFPEISSPVVRPVGEVLSAQWRGKKISGTLVQSTVGERISWRDAVEKQINVYNREGRLLLRNTVDRGNLKLVYNPGPEVYSLRLLVDLTELMMLESTHWGDPHHVRNKIAKYCLETVDIDLAIKMAVEMNQQFFKQVTDWIQKDPWAIYKINAISSNIILESSCDYRHFRCNEMLIEQQRALEPDNEILLSWAPKEEMFGPVRYEDLDQLFNELFLETGHQVASIPELFVLLDNTKNNVVMTRSVLSVFEKYMKTSRQNGNARELVSKLTSPDFINQVLSKNHGLTSTDVHIGTGVIVL